MPHRIEAELISALGMGTNLDVAAADQSRPSATRAAKLIHPRRRIFIPHLGKMGLAHFSPSECEVARTSRGSEVRIAAEDQFAAHKAVQHSLQRSPLVLESACQLRPAAAEAADPLTGLGAHHVNRLAEADVTVGV